MKKGITVTILFEADALNRDEKIGGNILSIKKFTRGWGETYPYISRVAMRHYLFRTLNKSNPDLWKPAEVKVGEKNVIQFDIRKGNAIETAELDLFGYMSTIKGEKSITRKAPLGITKAIGLEPWKGDMSLNSNHDLVSRAPGNTPDIYNKEEAHCLFKCSFTLDIEKLGIERFAIGNDSDIEDNDSKITVKFAEDKITIKNINIKEGENIISGKIERSTIELKKENGFVFIKSSSDNESEEGLKIGKKFFPIIDKEKIPETENEYWYKIDFDELKENGKEWTISISRYTHITKSKIENKENYKKGKIVEFKLIEDEKQKRIREVLNAIYNGLYYHSSGESPGIVPLFFIAGIVKVPIPVFHQFVEVEFYKQNSNPKFKIVESLLKNAISNGWIEIKKEDNNNKKPLVFIKSRVTNALSNEFINQYSIETDWEKFINNYLFELTDK